MIEDWRVQGAREKAGTPRSRRREDGSRISGYRKQEGVSVLGKAGEGKLEREQEGVSLPGNANKILNPENIPVQFVPLREYQEAGSLFQKL